jgi:N-methylhydantoinase B/oxoprolinase/acetone carboxylase alpha subunit
MRLRKHLTVEMVIVKEGLDASSCLFTIRGETLAQATAIPIHLAMLIPILAKMLEVFPLATMKPGDVYCMNDPYLGGRAACRFRSGGAPPAARRSAGRPSRPHQEHAV